MQSSASHLVAPVLLEVKLEQDEAPIELIPEGLWWFYIVGPPLFTATLDAPLLLGDLESLLRALLMTYIHTAAVAGPIHFMYSFVLPRVFTRVRSRWSRLALHVLTVSLIVPIATIAVKPLMLAVCRNPMDIREALIISYVISTLMLLAALSYQRLRQRAQRVERLAVAERHAALAAQLRALQSRTNPHFLFNSLNAVASLIPKDPTRAEQTVERLADVLRYSLQRTRRGLVRLEEELEVVLEYLEIESVRFGDRLSYRFEIDPRTKRFRVPPMTLEPLVENAVLHGIGSKREGGTIVIGAQRWNDRLLLTIEDDGPGCGGSTHSGTGTGIQDLRHRLRLLYGRDDLLALERGPRGGCMATLALPLSKQ
jgi:sensor histidine kinase YesM